MNQKRNSFSTQMIVEGGIMLALAYVLSLFSVYEMPQGGSISLSMLPIMIFALRWGAVPGVIVGALFGIINLIIKPQIYHPIQVLLDYPLPSAFIGLSGISLDKDKSKFTGYLPMIIVGYVLKFISHFLSGYVFFGEYAPEGMHPAKYSFIYNLSYNGPELILFIVVIAILWKPLKSVLVRQK